MSKKHHDCDYSEYPRYGGYSYGYGYRPGFNPFFGIGSGSPLIIIVIIIVIVLLLSNQGGFNFFRTTGPTVC